MKWTWRTFVPRTLSDRISVLSLLVAVWGTVLTIMYADQKQTIEGFEELLNNMQKQNASLSEQLKISQDLQRQANASYNVKRQIEANELSAASGSIKVHYASLARKDDYNNSYNWEQLDELEEIQQLLKPQFDNIYLMENPNAYEVWRECNEAINSVNKQRRTVNVITDSTINRLFSIVLPKIALAVKVADSHVDSLLKAK